ncbi:MAG: phenylalanine--tRNA ligase subunit beta [Candidatus Bathyarchaeia archaeon]
MPTISIMHKDLCDLLGLNVPIEEIKYRLFSLKYVVEDIVDDEIFLEVTADRPDLLSVEGIARELKGLLGKERGIPKYKIYKSDVSVKVLPGIENIRPYIACAVLKNISLNDEAVRQIMQLQEKLHVTYCRNRKKVSIGVHDLDKVKHELFYNGVEPEKIKFIPLDEEKEMNGIEILEKTQKGREYGHLIKDFPRYPLLYDSDKKVLSMPPIINGILTKVTSKTKNLLLDVTGTDESLVNFVNNIMVTNIVERGGIIGKVKIIYPNKHVITPNLRPRKIKINKESIEEIIGIKLSNKDILRILRMMRYDIASSQKNVINVFIPPYRVDILHEVDLVEDVAIGYGYDRLEPITPFTMTIGKELPMTKFLRLIRDLMVGFGFQEVLSFIMCNKNTLFNKMNLQEGEVVEVANPLSSEYSVLRNWLIPVLLNFLSLNRHVVYPQKIFECGDVAIVDHSKPNRTKILKKLAATICNYKVSYEDIQGPLYSLLSNLGFENWEVKRIEHPSFIQGRVAELFLESNQGEHEIGILGEIHPMVLNNFELENPVVAFELNLNELLNIKK